MSARRAVRPEPDGPRIERVPGDGGAVQPIWRLRSLSAARGLLRARHATRQAGFTAEYVPQGALRHHPILMSDGPLHDEQRRKVARFLAPATISARYDEAMVAAADRYVAQARQEGRCRLDELALHYTVEVTAQVVGLTESPVPAMARRLERFFSQPPFDLTRRDLGRTRRQWMQAAANGIRPIVGFYLADVRPALASRRRRRRDDIISHLLDEGYSTADVLVECVTYGTAGMVTTREFVVMAAWHLLTDDALLADYLAGDTARRTAVLEEIIRLEPVVGHLYRRVTTPVETADTDGCPIHLPPGELVDVCVRAANVDPELVGSDPEELRPGRELPAGVSAAGLAFGDGEHVCPGRFLAIAEADVLLRRLLADRPRLTSEPTVAWDDLVEGYQLRGVELVW